MGTKPKIFTIWLPLRKHLPTSVMLHKSYYMFYVHLQSILDTFLSFFLLSKELILSVLTTFIGMNTFHIHILNYSKNSWPSATQGLGYQLSMHYIIYSQSSVPAVPPYLQFCPTNSTNQRLCSTSSIYYWKNPCISITTLFNHVLFKDQL